MKKIRLWQIPDVRRKILLDWTVLALLLAPCPIVAYFGWTLFPVAFPIASVLLLAVILFGAYSVTVRADAYVRTVADAVDARVRAPALWDAVHSAAAAVGIRAPRIYVLGSIKRSYAFSWGLGASASVAVNDRILREFTPPMLAVTMAHEVAHLAVGDTATGLRIRGAAAWLKNAAFLLFIAGLATVIRSSQHDVQMYGLACCFIGALSVLWVQIIGERLLPWLSFWKEYAADTLAIAITGDPESMVRVMLYAVVQRGDIRVNNRPLPRMGDPPPLTRIRRILRSHPGALKR